MGSFDAWRPPPLHLVSVVIPTHDAGDLIFEQLDAVLSQDYQGSFEVLVVDNKSTDGLDSRLRAYPAVRVVKALDRTCVAYARNAGVQAARGELVAFCDADDVVDPAWLRCLVDAAADAQAATGPLQRVFPGRPPDPRAPTPPPRYLDFLPITQGCNMAWWKDAYQALGGSDETMLTGEDVDLCWRLQVDGGHIGWAPDAWIRYRQRADLYGAFRQHYRYGVGDVCLYLRFRSHGLRRRPLRAVGREVAALLARLPRLREPAPQRWWISRVGFLAGHAAESARCHTFFL